MEEDTAAVDAEEKQAGWFATNMERLDEFNRHLIKLVFSLSLYLGYDMKLSVKHRELLI